ncbi:alpha/beta hydrolase [Nevskia ramosa]|uniref:alpha/beta hydrolase n=2 Tax=Nevskia ramosa TaxID=64002 RepID=UPI0003B54836|nr:alpha/beta hydrolase [Nevskia ramosa]
MRPISSLILSFFAALLLLSACSGQQLANDLTPDKGYRLSSNVGFDAATGLQLDVYSPNGVANAPVVVFFFGGRWQEGSKEAYKFVGQALAARGFVAVLPNYRLYPQVRYPSFLTDNAKAVKWVHSQIAQYGGDPTKIVVMGHSSGAYNAAMLTLNPALMKSVGGDRAWIRAMIGLAGPYDFLPLTDPDLRDLFGAPENYDQTQPMMYADGTNPPMLLMHGQDDKTVFSTNTEHLAARIQRANGPVETVIYPEMSHRKIIATLATSSLIKFAVGQSDVMFYVNDFVKRNTGANAPKPRQEAPGGLQTIVPTP